MRFVTFHTLQDRPQRFGVRLGDTHIVDVEAATAVRLAGLNSPGKATEIAAAVAPGEAVAFIAGGEQALLAARETLAFADRALRDGAQRAELENVRALLRLDEVVLDAPVPNAGKFIAAGKNFIQHLNEMSRPDIPKQPVAFAQMNSTFVGPDRVITIPPETRTLDYEVEAAIVIGRAAFRIKPEDALQHIFGLTIFNDLSARDLYRAEQGAGIPLLGKNLANFAPMGPHLVTIDEFDSIDNLRITTRINGETRQNSTLDGMLFHVPRLIAWWSQIGLEPGDIISTGTPSGVAAGRKPGETPWWLKPGDLVETEVEGVGVLRTTIA